VSIEETLTQSLDSNFRKNFEWTAASLGEIVATVD
jgi:hypothetical protein